MRDILKVLEFLSDVPVGKRKDVSEILNEQFPLGVYGVGNGDVSRFLNSLKEFTDFNDHTSFRRESPYGFIGLNLALTNDGVNEVKKEQDRIQQHKVHQSAIDVNESIIATNISVQATNKSIVDISQKQADINQKIADNSKIQTDILSGQKWILWSTVAIAACSALISFLNYRQDVPNNQLQQELKTINKRINMIEHKLSQKVMDSSHAIVAAKTSIKKK